MGGNFSHQGIIEKVLDIPNSIPLSKSNILLVNYLLG